jgi:hypothetical protein
LATKFEIPKPNFNLPIYLPTRISTQQILHECERNGDVRPGQFLLEVSATPILVMGSVMGLLFLLGNGAFLTTPLVNPGYRNWVFKYLWAWLRQTPTIFRVGGNLASV